MLLTVKIIAILEKLITINMIDSNCFGVSISFLAIIEDLSSLFFNRSLSIGFNEKKAVSAADIIAVIINNNTKEEIKKKIELIIMSDII